MVLSTRATIMLPALENEVTEDHGSVILCGRFPFAHIKKTPDEASVH